MNKTITLIFLLAFVFAMTALNVEASSQTNPEGNNLEGTVKSMEKKYSVSITIEKDALNETLNSNSKEVLNSATIEEAMEALVAGSTLKYKKLRNDYFIIKTKSPKQQAVPVTDTIKGVDNQLRNISGKVTEATTGSPLPGVNVVVLGTTIGTVTDMEGSFIIMVKPEHKILEISMLGMKTITREIGSESYFNFQLKEDAFGLDEVIVAGVASKTSKKNLTISVDKVNDKILKEASASSVASTLQGKVAGVSVIQANGQPGSAAKIRIRGSTTLTGQNSPLIIMDGIIISTRLSDININDIESMEVVKGAAAAALYGSRAANGVIVITTNRGNRNEIGKTTVVIRQELGTQGMAKYIDQSNSHPYKLAEDWQDYPNFTKYEGVNYDSVGNVLGGGRHLTDSTWADNPYARYIDHQKDFFESGLYNSTYASVAGNSAKTNFLIGYEYNRQEGVLFATDGYKRNNFRINVDHKLTDKIKLSTSNLIVFTKEGSPGSNTSFYNLLYVAPDIDLYQLNFDGTPYKMLPDTFSIGTNPLYPLANTDRYAERTSLIGNIMVDYAILPWISLNAKYTYEYKQFFNSTYRAKGYIASNNQSTGGSLYNSNYNQFDNNLQLTANLNKQFNNFTTKLKLSYLYENSTFRYSSISGQNFIYDGIPHFNNFNPEDVLASSNNGEIVSLNYFGIMDVDYKDKYLLSALLRYDGSSLFGPEVRWNPYYRFSLGWRITEDFQIPGIDELKIRASIGTSGLRPFYSNQYETYIWAGSGLLKSSTLGNNYLKPSETTEIETGINIDFLNMFSLVFTYSQSETKGSIALVPLASHTGFPYQWQNVGVISSRVYEAALNMNLIKKKNINWSAFINYDNIRQVITELDMPEYNTGPRNAFFVKEGETFGLMYGYKWITSLEEMEAQLPQGNTIEDYEVNSDGFVILAGTEGTAGEAAIKLDSDNDGVANKVEIGNGNPNFQMSIGNTLEAYNFTLYFLLNWKSGGDIYNYSYQYTFRDKRAIEYDQSNKPDSEKKSIFYYDNFYDGTGINSYFVEDGSYLKLREVSLYYTFDKRQLNGFLGGLFEKVRIGFQSRNVLTFTNYRGYDPEVASTGSGTDQTLYPFDNFGYPNYRTYTGSIQLNF